MLAEREDVTVCNLYRSRLTEEIAHSAISEPRSAPIAFFVFSHIFKHIDGKFRPGQERAFEVTGHQRKPDLNPHPRSGMR